MQRGTHGQVIAATTETGRLRVYTIIIVSIIVKTSLQFPIQSIYYTLTHVLFFGDFITNTRYLITDYINYELIIININAYNLWFDVCGVPT